MFPYSPSSCFYLFRDVSKCLDFIRWSISVLRIRGIWKTDRGRRQRGNISKWWLLKSLLCSNLWYKHGEIQVVSTIHLEITFCNRDLNRNCEGLKLELCVSLCSTQQIQVWRWKCKCFIAQLWCNYDRNTGSKTFQPDLVFRWTSIGWACEKMFNLENTWRIENDRKLSWSSELEAGLWNFWTELWWLHFKPLLLSVFWFDSWGKFLLICLLMSIRDSTNDKKGVGI